MFELRDATKATKARGPMVIRVSELVLALPRPAKRIIALLVDILICAATVALAYWLRLGEWVWPSGTQWLSYVVAIMIAIPLYIRFGLYRAIFRFVGWGAMNSVIRASIVYGVVYALIFTGYGISNVPRTIGVMQPILLFLAIGGSRALARFWLGGGYHKLLRASHRRRVMIYGSGSAGRQLAAALTNSEEMEVVGFVDDDPTLTNSMLNGRKIYQSVDLHHLISELAIDDLLLAIPSASRQRRKEIIESIRGTHASIRTLPGLTDLAHGRVTVNDLRELDIEDLLGRDPVPPNDGLLAKNIAGKCVMVSGAGGSIGSELCRQIIRQKPSKLLLVEMSEYNLYAIHQDIERQLSGQVWQTDLIPLLASVADARRMHAILETHRPETIYHAAAFKHVPLVESNPTEGVLNNVIGTRTLALAAMEFGVDDFVLISTDKAVRPTSTMGATKRLAEMTLQALADQNGSTRFSMVRFGNVLGSSGSVVPLFRQQVRAGGPVTVTHAEMTRYFMTIPEAALLVIQAGAMAHGGEVFVLDMGDPVKIHDLAQKVIELSGLTVRDADSPDGDIAIEIVGLRPGEKLYEELLIGDDPEQTSHPRILKARDKFMPLAELDKELAILEDYVISANADAMRGTIIRAIPEHQMKF
jgi:FlaA1/EpsC-like NDP-sugar epimerase